MNKFSKYPKGVIASLQTFQDYINLSEALTKGEKSNDSLNRIVQRITQNLVLKSMIFKT